MGYVLGKECGVVGYAELLSRCYHSDYRIVKLHPLFYMVALGETGEGANAQDHDLAACIIAT